MGWLKPRVPGPLAVAVDGAVGLRCLDRRPVMEPACSYSPCDTPNGTLSKCSKSGCPHYAHHVCFLSSYPHWEETAPSSPPPSWGIG
jgi:hypothetical protein